MLKKLSFFLVLMVCCGASFALSDHTLLQIGVWAPKCQIVDEDFYVSGLKLNLPFGSCNELQGVDFGFASSVNSATGLQMDFILNRVHGNFSGVQLGLINQAENTSGFVLGGLNVTSNRMRGLQVGLVNSAMDVHGVQFGLLNYTEFMSGIQIGLVNVILNSRVPIFPFVNFCF